jgi:hypothetical protein
MRASHRRALPQRPGVPRLHARATETQCDPDVPRDARQPSAGADPRPERRRAGRANRCPGARDRPHSGSAAQSRRTHRGPRGSDRGLRGWLNRQQWDPPAISPTHVRPSLTVASRSAMVRRIGDLLVARCRTDPASCKSWFVAGAGMSRRREFFRMLRDCQPPVVTVAVLLVVRLITFNRGREAPCSAGTSRRASDSARSPGEANASIAQPFRPSRASSQR